MGKAILLRGDKAMGGAQNGASNYDGDVMGAKVSTTNEIGLSLREEIGS